MTKTPEEIKAEETATAEAKAAEEAAQAEKEKADADFEAQLDGLSDEEKETKRAEREASNPDKIIDHKSEAEKEREARKAREKAAAEERFKEAERKRKAREAAGEDPDEEDDEDDKPLTRKELDARLTKEREEARKEAQADIIKDIAGDLAESDDEAEHIIEIHKNRTFPAHLSLREQMEEAHAIANRKKLVIKNKELGRALKSKQTSSKDNASTHRDGMEGTAPKIDANTAASYKRAGFTYDTTSKHFKKKLPSGKTLCKDPKTKKTWIA